MGHPLHEHARRCDRNHPDDDTGREDDQDVSRIEENERIQADLARLPERPFSADFARQGGAPRRQYDDAVPWSRARRPSSANAITPQAVSHLLIEATCKRVCSSTIRP